LDEIVTATAADVISTRTPVAYAPACASTSARNSTVTIAQTPVKISTSGLVAFAPWASRSPYEVWVAGAHDADGFDTHFLETALGLGVQVVRRLREAEGAVPLNIWLHDAGHAHLELVPRFSTHAGFELGAGIYLNSLAPEEAAERLRDGSVVE